MCNPDHKLDQISINQNEKAIDTEKKSWFLFILRGFSLKSFFKKGTQT